MLYGKESYCEKYGEEKNRETERYVFFLTGSFSQWHPSEFRDEEGQQFNSAEQYMMYQKAKLFGDEEIAKQILEAKTPKEQKELGRAVKGFVLDVWNQHAQDIVYKGNWFKFTQNSDLLQDLERTAGKKLVEAAHYDPVWGIGLRAHDPDCLDEAKWQGTNWLGNSLTRLREHFLKPKPTVKNRPSH